LVAYADEMFELARMAEVYGSGRFVTVEQNLLIPNIPFALKPLLKEPPPGRFSIEPENLNRGLVSCTGSELLCHH